MFGCVFVFIVACTSRKICRFNCLYTYSSFHLPCCTTTATIYFPNVLTTPNRNCTPRSSNPPTRTPPALLISHLLSNWRILFILLCLASVTQRHVFKRHPWCSRCRNCTSFCDRTIAHCTCTAHLIHPSIHPWTFGLFPPLGWYD